MKAIKTALIINSIRSKKDKSLGISAETPELSPEEAVEFMKLQGINLNALLEPTDFKVESMEVKNDLDLKSPSQRLRSVLYATFMKLKKDNKENGLFQDFYEKKMEQIIEYYKGKLYE